VQRITISQIGVSSEPQHGRSRSTLGGHASRWRNEVLVSADVQR
jgi:hypothetical protein